MRRSRRCLNRIARWASILALVLRSAPALQATTWYGMPAYAKDGTVICSLDDATEARLSEIVRKAASEEGSAHDSDR